MDPIRRFVLALVAALAAAGCNAESPDPPVTNSGRDLQLAQRGLDSNPAPAWPRHVLKAEKTWQLNLPDGQPFDASALLITSRGEFLTVNDRGAALFRLEFVAGADAVNLVALPNCFTAAQLRPLSGHKFGRYDLEGLSEDSQGRIYACEEADRWILRCDPAKGTVEKLEIDWTPVKKYFSAGDFNASFEGIAVGGQRLFVANERQLGRLIAVDLETLRVIDDFAVRASTSKARDNHYSDLSWFDGVLYVLCRESRVVLAVEPERHRVLAEYDFRDLERDPEVLYRSLYPTGQMEGLAVQSDTLWLLTDNNGSARARYPRDTRPTLFQCKRAPLPNPR